MSQTRSSWLEIIQQILHEFQVVDMGQGDLELLNQLYPELRLALLDPASCQEPRADLYRPGRGLSVHAREPRAIADRAEDPPGLGGAPDPAHRARGCDCTVTNVEFL